MVVYMKFKLINEHNVKIYWKVISEESCPILE